MKAIKYDYDIDFEHIKQLMQDIDKISIDEDIIIYMNSKGGSCSDAIDLADYINRRKDRIEIVCSWEMSSAAFDLLLQVECKIKLIDGMFSRIHLYSNDIKYREINNKNSIDSFLIQDLDKTNSKFLKDLVIAGFTSDEIEKIKQGIIINCNLERVQHMIKTLNHNAILV